MYSVVYVYIDIYIIYVYLILFVVQIVNEYEVFGEWFIDKF